MADIYSEFKAVVDTKDESAVRTFLVDRFTELPEAVQQKVAFSFLRDALAEESAVAKIQEQIIVILETLKKQKDEEENRTRIDEIKKELGAS